MDDKLGLPPLIILRWAWGVRYGLPMIWTATVYRLPGFSIVIRNGMYMDVDRYDKTYHEK